MLTSCSFKKDIMVSYLYDGVETPFSVEPKKFDSDFQHYKVDMSYIPKNEFALYCLLTQAGCLLICSLMVLKKQMIKR